MINPLIPKIDERFDLVLERIVDIPKELIWMAWTTPEHLKKWFCPLPWKTIECEIELRPGGTFRTVMQSPEGQKHPNSGCYLEIIPNQKLVWTDALQRDYRPSAPSPLGFHFTATLLLEAHSKGTKYTAIGSHADEESRKKHAEMGFHEGWGAVLDQLVALLKESN